MSSTISEVKEMNCDEPTFMYVLNKTLNKDFIKTGK